MAQKSTPIPQAAAALGYLGALPFVLASFALWFVEPETGARLTSIMILASAIVFGFVGGLQLGMSMLDEGGASFFQLLIGAGVICLAGFVASAQMAPSVALIVMTGAFVGQLWIDLKGDAATRSPAWYAGLRIPLTLLVVASLMSATIKVYI